MKPHPLPLTTDRAACWWRTLSGWALMFVPAVLYVASFAGITSSNDGSHYALLRALVDTGSPVIDRYAILAERVDLSAHEGHFYSDRPPGTAVIAAPLYMLGHAFPSFWSTVPSKWDGRNPRLAPLLLGPAIATWLSACLFWRLQRWLGVRPWLGIAGCATLLLGTTLWKYGTCLFSHAFSACLVLAAVTVLLTVRNWSLLTGLGLGALLGAATAVEYQNAVFVVIAMGWFAWARRPGWRVGVGVAAGLVLTLLPLFGYFKVCFGGWLTTSYAFRVADPWSRRIDTTFAGNVLEGLTGLLWRKRPQHRLVRPYAGSPFWRRRLRARREEQVA